MAFATLALAELVLVFSIRSGAAPLHRAPRNGRLLAAVAASAVVLALVRLRPAAAATRSDTVPLGLEEIAVVVALALTPALVAEAVKAVGRRG